ncbi:MAG: helix-turn-helix domain-containing protein [Cyclobacteriaceae bacterium]|nr:helix-turn-helix domain-containing protein [Cyclobacteriaceae bacterium]
MKKGMDKQLTTIKKASEEIGCSPTFIKQLIKEGLLKRYKIHSATYISMREFESIAKHDDAINALKP